ncbi:MAG: DUF479 domain-containing protein [Pseudomonadota bacterium]|nr:MAG: DUF479 domain-containing protein [Pseudomonadota bacterium]
MNYLAHAYLSCESSDAMIGGMLGDFVKGSLAGRYTPGIRSAIALHRAIDRYTDRHPTVRQSNALISAKRRRFAGIMVDVFYDHFLAVHWARFSSTPLKAFTHNYYAVLHAQVAGFPPRLQRVLPYMMRDDWLASYAEVESVDAALNGIARRFQRFARARVLCDGVQELTDNYGALEAQFLAFFPELVQFTHRNRGQSMDSAA